MPRVITGEIFAYIRPMCAIKSYVLERRARRFFRTGPLGDTRRYCRLLIAIMLPARSRGAHAIRHVCQRLRDGNYTRGVFQKFLTHFGPITGFMSDGGRALARGSSGHCLFYSYALLAGENISPTKTIITRRLDVARTTERLSPPDIRLRCPHNDVSFRAANNREGEDGVKKSDGSPEKIINRARPGVIVRG